MTDVKPITLTTTMTEDDVAEISMHARYRLFGLTGVGRLRFAQVFIVVATFFVAFAIPEIMRDFGGEMESPFAFQIGLIGAGIVLAALYPRFNRWAIRRASRAYQKLPLSMQLRFDDAGIHTVTDGQSGSMAW